MSHNYESGVPLGGLGCGKLEFCPDGAIRSVTTHNNIDQPFSNLETRNDYTAEGLSDAFCFASFDGKAAALKLHESAPVNTVDGADLSYEGLYPRAILKCQHWQGIQLQVEAFSPLVMHEGGDFRDSSLPVAIFQYTVTNHKTDRVNCSVGFSWPHVIGCGGYPSARIADLRGNETTEQQIENSPSLRYHHTCPKVDCRLNGEYLLRTSTESTGDTTWAVASWSEALWRQFEATGRLPNQRGTHGLGNAGAVAPGNTGMLCVSRELDPGETMKLSFVLAWYFPEKPANMKPEVCYRNAYTRHFDSASEVAAHVTDNLETLHAQTCAWQTPLIQSSLPGWLSHKLINNLFPMASCSMYLDDGRFSINEAPTDMNGCMGTIDQRAAAATAYVMTVPEIAKAELTQFAAQQIDARHPQRFGRHWNYATGKCDLELDRLGAIKHEIGWDELEEGKYGSADWCNLHWPDLTSVFVLQCYQQIIWDHDQDFLAEVYPKIKEALAFQKRLDQNGDGIADLWGPGSSTFDNHMFPYYGACCFIATLYLAALRAAIKLAEYMDDQTAIAGFEKDFSQAQQTVETQLWDESKGYYINWVDTLHAQWENSDRAHGRVSENSMLASLAGVWFAQMLDLGEILNPERVASSLQRLYERNVKPVRYCAANEAKPDGTTSFSWPFYGECYFAANAVYHGLVDAGMEMVEKFYTAAFVKNTSPWNIPLMWFKEDNGVPEWGRLYMTNPSSWTVLLALTGVRYNAFEQALTIRPAMELRDVPVYFPKFSGLLSHHDGQTTFALTRGSIPFQTLNMHGRTVTVNGAPVHSPGQIVVGDLLTAT